MKFLFSLLALLGLAAHSTAQDALDISTLFDIDLDSTDSGGCGYMGQTMQTILQDCSDLLFVGSQLVTDYNNNVAEARRLLDSFFQVQGGMNNAQLVVIASKLSTSQELHK